MRKIIITDKAKINIINIFDYLELKWNLKVKTKFAFKLNEMIKLIKINPDIFPISEKNKRLRKCVVTKQSTLYYSFNSNQIIIVSLFDTRQDPKKIKKIK